MKAAAKTRTSKPARRTPSAKVVALKGHAPAFREIVGLIQSARRGAFQRVNTELIGLYWRVSEYISRQLANDAWGEPGVDLGVSDAAPDRKLLQRKLCEFYQLAMPKMK